MRERKSERDERENKAGRRREKEEKSRGVGVLLFNDSDPV